MPKVTGLLSAWHVRFQGMGGVAIRSQEMGCIPDDVVGDVRNIPEN